MSTIAPINPNKLQTCPHGLSPGACPICGGMGGGSHSRKTVSTPKNEMSYNEMYAIWMQIKARQASKLEAKLALEKQAVILQNTKQLLLNMSEKLTKVLNKIESILPSPLNTLFSSVVNNILKPVFNIIKNFPNFLNNIEKFVQNIQREIYIAAEKLASVLGEIKNFVQKKVSETFKKFTKKVYKILNIFGFNSEDDFDEDKSASAEIFAFKTVDIKNLKEFMINLLIDKKEELNERIYQ